MKNRRIMLAFMLLACLSSVFTGCIRMGVQVMSDQLSNLGPRPGPSIMVTDKFFDGTKHVAPMVFSPLAPLVIIDLPLEFLWDVLILPTQLKKRAYLRRLERIRIAMMDPVSLAKNGHYDEFKKKVAILSSEEKSRIMVNLARDFAENPDKFSPFIDYLFSLDHRCGGDFVLNSHVFKAETALTRHLFELGLRPADFPQEHAVFNAVNYIHLRYYGIEYSTEKQLERIRLLLENGCNPNAFPEYNCKHIHSDLDDFAGDLSLDLARKELSAYSKRGNEKEVGYLKEIVSLLEAHGAKTAKELNLSRDFKQMKLIKFFDRNEFEHFRMRMSVASRKEKEEAMLGIAFSCTPVQRFEPYCRLLLDDGIPLCAPRFSPHSSPPYPQELDFLKFAFANGLKASDYPESHVIASICKRFELQIVDYDKGYIELLHLLLKNGFSPNVPAPFDSQKWTALDILEWTLRPHSVSISGRLISDEELEKQRKMVREMIELVKQYGGISSKQSSR